jgi:hypothetical protein
MKVLTSFTKLVTGEGIRISYTYSEINEAGCVLSQNNRENFVVTDKEVKEHINAVENYIQKTFLEEK